MLMHMFLLDVKSSSNGVYKGSKHGFANISLCPYIFLLTLAHQFLTNSSPTPRHSSSLLTNCSAFLDLVHHSSPFFTNSSPMPHHSSPIPHQLLAIPHHSSPVLRHYSSFHLPLTHLKSFYTVI